MKKTQWAWHFSGELSDCIKRFMIQQFVLQAILSFILAILLLGLPAWNQLHAAKLVLIVEDENAKPVPGMEVIHTDKNGDKAKGTYDETAGVYRFGDLVDGAGSVTAFHPDYRLAGVRWFVHTPDTVRIVSVRGGYLLYKEGDVTFWYKVAKSYVNFVGGSYGLIDSLGFKLAYNGRVYIHMSGKPLDPMESRELALVRAKGIEWSGIVVRIVKMKKGSEELHVPYQDDPEHDPEFVGNRLRISMHYLTRMTPEEQCAHLESLFKQYGLTLDPLIYGDKITMEIANLNDSFNYDVVMNCGIGTCIVDQIRFMLDDTNFARVNFAVHARLTEP